MLPAESSSGTLWIVATPIGSLGDFSPRAAEVIQEVDILLAEDTRRARTLLSHAGVRPSGRLQSLHEHNEGAKLSALLAHLEEGGSLALMSDAGTPVLSDPGFTLVRAVREAGMTVLSVPGPSSFTAALAASGLPPLPATLCGFLPPRSGPRRRRIEELSGCPWTVVVLVSPHRLAKEIADLAEILGRDRPATLLAEISKRFERAESGTLGSLATGAEAARPRGEYVLVIGPESDAAGSPAVADVDAIRQSYARLQESGFDRREALKETARRHGLHRREVFAALAAAQEAENADSEP